MRILENKVAVSALQASKHAFTNSPSKAFM